VMFFLHRLGSGNSWFAIASCEHVQLTDATFILPGIQSA
jgi:hypothetical protein